LIWENLGGKKEAKEKKKESMLFPSATTKPHASHTHGIERELPDSLFIDSSRVVFKLTLYTDGEMEEIPFNYLLALLVIIN
jgi:hypothetical protein